MPTSLDPSALSSLRDQLRGPVLTPGDEVYDDARQIWNARLQQRPAAVARCSGAADVQAAVRVARAHDLDLAVKSGGHSYAGRSTHEGGLLVDLSAMTGIRVNPQAQRARVQAGATWGSVDHETQAHGLATTGATVSTVGVAGYTLGGGTGHLARSCGLATDNLVSADVITAEGDWMHASADANPDLFWGLRGGGGTLGIVTSFEFQLHEVGPEVLAGQIIYPMEQAREGLRVYRSLMQGAPPELQVYAFFIHVPPLDVLPDAYHGAVALDLVVAYTGDLSDGEAAIRPLREIGEPLLDAVRPQPYTELQQTFDDGVPKGHRWATRAGYLDTLSDAAIDTIIDHVDPLPGPFSMMYLEPLGGAIRAVDPSDTAFPHRGADFGFHLLTGWTEPEKDASMIAWTKEFYEMLNPHTDEGVYVNLLGEDENDRIPEAYGRNYERLAELKAKWDPDAVFRSAPPVAPRVASS